MKKSVVNFHILLALGLVASTSNAADLGLENCLQAAKKENAGVFVKLEKLNVAGKAVYELEVRNANNEEAEFMCDADSGKIIERETEVDDADSPAFKKNAKITEKEAADIALKAVPGKIREVEFEVEENGASSYEIDIVDAKGIQTKLEINAATGKIIETAIEEWEIGEEAAAKR